MVKSVLIPPHCSGGCTVSAHGFFLQSGLQPQMVLTTGQDAEVFHVVSRTRLLYPSFDLQSVHKKQFVIFSQSEVS